MLCRVKSKLSLVTVITDCILLYYLMLLISVVVFVITFTV